MVNGRGVLYLLPNVLSEDASTDRWLAPSVAEAVAHMDGIIAESAKGARAFLRRFPTVISRPAEYPVRILNEHSTEKEGIALLLPMVHGATWGVISDAGLPCLADPGAMLVKQARHAGIAVEAFAGPSSIVLALLLSGLAAQSFAFHGYLPRDQKVLRAKLRVLEQRMRVDVQTQLFIETPYRSQKMLETLLDTLREDTILAIAAGLTSQEELVVTDPISFWRTRPRPSLHGRPVVFLLGQLHWIRH